MRQRVCLGISCAAVLASFVLTRAAHAQTVAVRSTAEVDLAGGSFGGTPLSSLLGLTVARNLVYSPDPNERLRAVDRLASLGSPEAIEALLEATESGSPLGRDPTARLAVVRALAPFADRREVRSFLIREMMDAGARRDVTSSTAALVRSTAALALARKGDDNAIKALTTAGALRGPAGDAARAAMVAVPPAVIDMILFEPLPEDIDAGEDDEVLKARREDGASKTKGRDDVIEDVEPPKVAGKGKVEADHEGRGKRRDAGAALRPKARTLRPLNAPVIHFLGDLGDVRAIRALREELDRSDRPTRAAAALALAKIGDASVASVARSWLDEKDARFALAGADVLVALGDAGAPAAVKRMLDKEAVRSQAVRLAYELASPETVEPLAKLIPTLDAPDQIRAVMALGRAGACPKLVAWIGDARLGPAAVTALAMCPAESASAEIEKGLGSKAPDRRRAFVRVAVLRALALADEPSSLRASLDDLSVSKDPSDVELASVGRVALGAASMNEVLAEAKGKSDALALAIVAGAARGGLARNTDELAPLAKELEDADPEALTERQIAAGVALLSTKAADSLSFLKLLQLAESGGALASLAARALPRRADESMKGRLLALLSGTDPSVRVGVAQGLAESPHKAAVSWLANAYVREDDVHVRRALVASLVRRSELQRTRPLELARDLDPDPEVRALAAAGLSASPSLSGGGPRTIPASVELGGLDPSLVAYFAVAGSDGSASARAVRAVLPSGIALPMVTAADGALLTPGIPFGKASLEIVTVVPSSP